MNTNSKRQPVRHGISTLPLFAWADRFAPPPLSEGGRWVARRYRLPPRIANVVAELAGIGGGLSW
jgi:hypothetical protein